MIKTITSEANAIVKLAKRLRGKRGRDKEGAFLIEGRNLLAEARKSGARVTHIFLREGSPLCEDADALRSGGVSDAFYAFSREINAPIRAENEVDAEMIALSTGLFDAIADTVTPQDVMAIVRKPVAGRYFGTDDSKDGASGCFDDAGARPGDESRARSALGSNGRIALAVLDRIQDPGNAGNIIRSAEAADFTGVIAVKGTTDLFSQKAVRAAAGAIFRIPIHFAPDDETVLRLLKSLGVRCVACSMGGERAYDRATLSGDAAIIVGNEGNGLSETFFNGADERARIPMKEGSESLNVSVAAALMMFEKKRQEEVC
ncbi:MAG: RNA methyltransferase [Clostridiales Family XIII bacterium]|jgi:TrmH family RNA methyltransferase|nr:RNA methyltransferase [Clostridiales Family XIII bacterium]